MQVIYSILIQLLEWLLPVSKWISPKQRKFVEGRKNIFQQLQSVNSQNLIWIHTASLGEYEQAVPIMKRLKKEHPSYQLLVTFFSPSGYEIKKNDPLPDFVFYLPLDTNYNASIFVKTLHIKLAIFVKYEIWPNYMRALARAQIPSLLVSALFRQNQIYFQPYGGFMRHALRQFNHIFVQNEASYQLLNKKGFTPVSISGDTRYDRVNEQLKMDNQLGFMYEFKQDKLCFVFGSTWPEDEAVFVDFINSTSQLKFVIAPHEIKPQKIQNLVEKLKRKVVLHSEINNNLAEAEVLIVNRIGLLTKLYAYADLAYVGGGMGNSGLHNILEPATFGVPVLIGKNYSKFPEAEELKLQGGLFSIDNANSFQTCANRLLNDKTLRNNSGKKASQFVQENAGATTLVLKEIAKFIK